jgi:hypothetical protein
MNKSPERLILAIALGLLILGIGALAFFFPSLEDITSVTSTEPTNTHPLKPFKAEDLDASMGAWATPALWNTPPNKHHLFISDSFLFYASLYPAGNYIQKDDGLAVTPGGVLINWYRKYGLDFTDANIDREDPDGDGFSNKIEFLNEQTNAKEVDGTKSTNPVDPQSHPSYLSRLRLQKNNTRPFHILFKGYEQLNGENIFQIFLKDVPSSKQPGFKKTGDPLGYEGYIVGAFTQKMGQEKDPSTGLTMTVDQSTIVLEKPEIELKVTVPFRKEINSPESTVDFVMLMPADANKVIRVAVGKTFSLPEVPDVTYLLLNATDNGAVIRDVQAKRDIPVPKLDPAEWNDVPQPPTK